MPASFTIKSHAYGADGSVIARIDGERSDGAGFTAAFAEGGGCGGAAASTSGAARAGVGASAVGERMRRASPGCGGSGNGDENDERACFGERVAVVVGAALRPVALPVPLYADPRSPAPPLSRSPLPRAAGVDAAAGPASKLIETRAAGADWTATVLPRD